MRKAEYDIEGFIFQANEYVQSCHPTVTYWPIIVTLWWPHYTSEVPPFLGLVCWLYCYELPFSRQDNLKVSKGNSKLSTMLNKVFAQLHSRIINFSVWNFFHSYKQVHSKGVSLEQWLNLLHEILGGPI